MSTAENPMGEARKAFAELQGKMMDHVSSIKQVQSQIQGKESTKRRSVLTGQELSEVDDNTNCYKGIGRAYFLSTKKDLINEMDTSVTEIDTDLKKLGEQKAYFEKGIKEVEDNIRELLQANPLLAQEFGFRKAM